MCVSWKMIRAAERRRRLSRLQSRITNKQGENEMKKALITVLAICLVVSLTAVGERIPVHRIVVLKDLLRKVALRKLAEMREEFESEKVIVETT